MPRTTTTAPTPTTTAPTPTPTTLTATTTTPISTTASTESKRKTWVERKRKSRASNPARASIEKEESRQRMSILRSKNRSQKKSRSFRALLSPSQLSALTRASTERKVDLLGKWLVSKRHTFDPKVMLQKEIVNLFVPKIEMNRIEWEVAEFEIKMAQELLCDGDVGDDDDGGDGGTTGRSVVELPMLLKKKEKKKKTKAASISGSIVGSVVTSVADGSRAIGGSYPEASYSTSRTTALFPTVAKRSATGENDLIHQGSRPLLPIPSIVKSGSSISNMGGNKKEERMISRSDDGHEKSPHEVALDALLMAAERMESGEDNNSLPRKV